jgi:excinuclease ABC subunit C
MPKASSSPLPDLSALPAAGAPVVAEALPDAPAFGESAGELPDGSGGEAAGRTLRQGVEVIQDHLKRLPGKPGVYRMIGPDGEVLYVGKAKSLKNRVASYARGVGHTNRVTRMLQLVADMEFVVTRTETEALLLEANLIKRLRPRFNVILRDDKSFPFIAIRQGGGRRAAQLAKHRGAKGEGDALFGPFASAWAVNRSLTTLQKAFLLRSCSDSVYDSRSRPCMLHQIKRCAAPCVDLITPQAYDRLVDEAASFLRGRSADLQDRLADEMHRAAEGLDFEGAARLRDRIRALAAIKQAQGINPQTFQEADVFALALEGGISCIQVFFFRAGQNWGNRAYFPRHDRDAAAPEILEAFLAQFYDDKPVPALILTSHELPGAALLEEALSLRADARIELRMPQRGEKKDVMDHALTNAREALGRKMAESGTQTRLLEGLADVLGLEVPPQRIEIYDNSHIQGAHAVGAMVVAGPDGFEKGQYRKWTIRDAQSNDDFAMMREVFTRRFARLLKDDSDADAGMGADGAGEAPVWPDLIVIDGGEKQLAVVRDVAREAGLEDDLVLVAIAKGQDRDAGHEQFHMKGRPPFRMERNHPVLYYLQRLRDEAHRFVIGAHRQKRAAALSKNPLDEIPGVGPTRKKALLSRFGSARGVARAALSELRATPGINDELAQRLYDYFRG